MRKRKALHGRCLPQLHTWGVPRAPSWAADATPGTPAPGSDTNPKRCSHLTTTVISPDPVSPSILASLCTS